MSSLRITLPDGSIREVTPGSTPQQLAAAIGRRLEEAAVAAKIDDRLVDLNTPFEKDCRVSIITRDSKEGLEVLRHSTAHLLAHAVKELYPGTQITIGPVIEDGFYYDIDCVKTLTQDDLPVIEKKMEEIAGRKLVVTRHVYEPAKAIELFKGIGDHYKIELIQGFPAGETVSAYSQGEFIDLCRGPHVPNTAKLGKFKLLSVAGAYWRGDEKNKMLTRIYGTTFATQKELDEYLNRIEEAKKRDHRKLGPELGLFTFLPVAPAMPFYLPKGAMLFNALADFMRAETKSQGYQEVICPQVMTAELWKTSGHWGHYRENMFVIHEDEGEPSMALKPMNCPGHCALFGSTKHSYRELPLRFSEYSKLHRNERAGVTHGIMRTRSFSQDDGHVFCTEDQIEQEATALIKHIFHVYRLFGFPHVDVKLATRPEKFQGSIEGWDRATQALENALNAAKVPFSIAHGEGAFYGPKIEFHIKDSIGRFWQCGTVQLDPSLPEQFGLEYVGSDNTAKRPMMIHRAVLGSLERFMGILIEHHAGHLPIWISPTQVTIINVMTDQEEYCQGIAASLKHAGFRVDVDLRNEKLGYKIRDAQMKKTPLMMVIGKNEATNRTVSVRKTTGETVNDLTLEAFIQQFSPLLRPGEPTEQATNPGGTTH